MGNLVEWYDWYAYATFSLYFAPRFFPSDDRTSQLLGTAAVFAAGFLMRPLGGWALGRYADRHGRARALTLSVLLMCAGSLVIAVTPTYDRIGRAAPVLLLAARLLQGFSVGGEYGASATYLSEVAMEGRRGFCSSFQYVTLIMGQLLAQGVLLVLQLALLSPEQLSAWGWRIPFFIGAALAGVALRMRQRLAETDAFDAGGAPAEGGSLARLLAHPREIAIVVGMTLGGTVAFYTYTTYMQKFMVNTVGLSPAASSQISAATLFLFMLLQPFMGALSDRLGRRPLLLSFGVLGTLLTAPLLTAISHAASPWSAGLLIMIGLVIVSGYTSINAIVKAELFPPDIRALGVGLPYALTVSIFGGTAEVVALWCKSVGHEEAYYGYVTACILVSLGVYWRMPETRADRSEVRGDPEPASKSAVMNRLRSLLLCLAFLAAAAAGAFAEGRLSDEERAGELRIGASAQAVEKIMGGAPSRTSGASKADSGEWTQMWEYKRQGVTLLMAAPKKGEPLTLATISLEGPCKLDTARGIHLGSTDRDVHKAYGDRIDSDASTPEIIVAGSLTEGGLFFIVEKGKVTRIFIGSTKH